MKAIKHLYIIANGFDIHHGRCTSYYDFYTWAQENHKEVIDSLEERIGSLDKEWWCDFENNLAQIDGFDISQQISFENQPNLLDDHVDRQWSDAQVYTEQLFEGVYNDIKHIFVLWIQNGIKKTNSTKLVELNANESFFINFNYTDTLENDYGISPTQILHIHGSIYDNVFIIGHGKTMKEIESSNSPKDDSSETIDVEYDDNYEDGLQFHEQLALDAAISGIASQKKPVDIILENNNEIFNSFTEVKDIHIYGFSFSAIDLPYLDKIIEVIDKDNVHWEVSDYYSRNKENIERFFSDRAIKNYAIISLDDILVSYKQYKLF